MMQRKNKKKKIGLIENLFISKVSVFIILLNFFIFRYLSSGNISQESLKNLILYPQNIFNGHIYCLVTSGFIHFDVSHLLWNMVGVFIFARIVERQLGAFKTFLIYFGSMIISMSFSILFYVFVLNKNVAIIGASGAVMGLLAAAMLLEPFCITYEMILPIPVMVKGWMFLYADIKGFLGNEQDGVSHLAHLFGFISIAFLVYFLSKKDRKILRTGMLINVVSFIAFLFFRNWLILKL